MWQKINLRMIVIGLMLQATPMLLAQQSIIDRTSRQMKDFLDQMSNVKCTERVQQLKLDKNGRSEYSENSSYDYLILLEGSADDFLLNESRLADTKGQSKKPKDKKNPSLLITNGFSTLPLIFHPYYRSSFDFWVLPEETVEGRRIVPVQFKPVPGRRTPVALAVRGKEYPLEIAGSAWIEAERGTVLRMEVHLANDMTDVGLKSLHSEIEYSAVSFSGGTQMYWLPAKATIDVQTLRQHWRNIHQFSNYQRFSVDTVSTVAAEVDKR